MVTLEAFRALYPAPSADGAVYDFFQPEGVETDEPRAVRLVEPDRRKGDRSPFVSHLRAAALLARWRKEGVLVDVGHPRLFAWVRNTEIVASAGCLAMEQIPKADFPASVVRDARSRLEALGAVPALPVLRTRLPRVILDQPLYRSSAAELWAIRESRVPIDQTKEPAALGQEVVEAMRSLLGNRGSISVWVVENTSNENLPPVGALIWPWVEEAGRGAE